MLLKEQISEDMKSAMRAKDSAALGIIRMLMAAIKQREVDERITLDDEQITSVINKMIKQRIDSKTQFIAGGRQDLADKEQNEIDFLQKYLPKPLSSSEVDQLINETIDELKPQGLQEMGKVMDAIRKKAQGRADLGAISTKIKTILAAR
jgi:uncharacterized protein YqeY